jgi:hypothetical protein
MAAFLLEGAFMKTTMLSLCAAAVLMSAVGCHHKDPARPAEGPMERAGKKVDEAAEKTKDEATYAAAKAKADAKDAKETLKKKTK